jgi:hypothetical protein
VLAGWVVVSLTVAIDLGSDQAAPPGRLVPWALLGVAGALAWRLASRRPVLATSPT